MVRGAAHLRRAVARDGLPRGVLPAQQRRRVRAGWVLQFHSPERTLARARQGTGARHEEVAQAAGTGREEREQIAESGADEEEVCLVSAR